jgi:hypothetical protein
MDQILKAIQQMEERMNGKLENLEERMNGKLENLEGSMNGKLENLEGSMNGKLENLEGKMNGKFENLEGRLNGKFENLEGKFDVVTNQLDRMEDTLNIVAQTASDDTVSILKRIDANTSTTKQDIDYLAKQVGKHEMYFNRLNKS